MARPTNNKNPYMSDEEEVDVVASYEETSNKSGGMKKVVAAVIILLILIGAFLVWTKSIRHAPLALFSPLFLGVAFFTT